MADDNEALKVSCILTQVQGLTVCLLITLEPSSTPTIPGQLWAPVKFSVGKTVLVTQPPGTLVSATPYPQPMPRSQPPRALAALFRAILGPTQGCG